MDKLQLYKSLVSNRKQCRECMKLKGLQNVYLVNPSQYPSYDTGELGHWSMWQNSLSAKILLVGQDWAGTDYFFKYEGKDIDNNPTNQYLMKLFKILGLDIGTANFPIKHDELFFTNSILCMKSGRMDEKTENQWHALCGKLFLKPLIDIINPSTIIALGAKAYETIHKFYFPNEAVLPLNRVVAKQIKLTESLFLYPVYHCGTRGINMNRNIKLQIQDWSNIKRQMDLWQNLKAS